MCRPGLGSFLLAALLAWPSAADEPAQAIIAKADRVRAEWREAVISLRVQVEKPGAPAMTGRFAAAVKGDRTRIEFLEPSDAGKLVVTNGDDTWLLLPGTRNPIKVPKSQRLGGGFSAADIARTRFSEVYDAVLERTDDVQGRTCDVLRLTARKGAKTSYPVARVWVDRKERLYRKAVFLLASGRTAKDTTFDAYRPYHGVLALEKMTIIDALRPGTTVVEYLDYEKRSLSDELFNLASARTTWLATVAGKAR